MNERIISEPNYKKLILGRIDVMVETTAIMNYNLLKNGHEAEIKMLAQFGHKQRIFMVFSPDPSSNQGLPDIYDSGIERLRKSGRLAEIYKTYKIDIPQSFITSVQP